MLVPLHPPTFTFYQFLLILHDPPRIKDLFYTVSYNSIPRFTMLLSVDNYTPINIIV